MVGLLLPDKGNAERSHERALQRRKRAKNRSPGNQQPRAHQELRSLTVATTNKRPTGHTVHSYIKGKAKLDRSFKPGTEV